MVKNTRSLIENPSTAPEQHIADQEVPVIVHSLSHREHRARQERANKRRRALGRESAVGKGLLKGGVVGAAAVAAFVGINKISERHVESPASHQGHNKVYTARQGDTEWGIAEQAYPGVDPRMVIGYINEQEPPADRRDHLVRPGEKFVFAHDAQIGKLVKVDLEAKSLEGIPPPPAG